MDTLLALLPSAGTIVVVVLSLFLVRWILERGGGSVAGHSFRNQVLMLVLTAVGLLVVILVLPIGHTMRGQLLSLIGILLSAAIALSSTTVLGNAMAGLMLRAVRNFRMGDFIRAGEHFGRVSERGLFHTEIQTEHRELTTLPNLYLVTHPVTTLRTSGTIVSATVSLGYDVERGRIKDALLAAAKKADLEEPLVQVRELGDFSVTYRVSGLLTDVKRFVTVRSQLHACAMDELHGAGIEIVSPNFMNQRVFPEGRTFVPRRTRQAGDAEKESGIEDVAFDKADEAESLEGLRTSYKALSVKIDEAEDKLKKLPEGEEREIAQTALEALKVRQERLGEVVVRREGQASESE